MLTLTTFANPAFAVLLVRQARQQGLKLAAMVRGEPPGEIVPVVCHLLRTM